MGMGKAARMMMMNRSDDRYDKHDDYGRKEHDGYYDHRDKYRDYKKDHDYSKEIRAGGTFWMDDGKREEREFDRKSAEHWASKMKNEDGTTGAHWTMVQTTTVAKEHGIEFEHITDYCWWICLNMMYSDYYNVAVKHNCNTVAFYADMAKAFLFDKDAKSPRDKISAYYEYVVV